MTTGHLGEIRWLPAGRRLAVTAVLAVALTAAAVVAGPAPATTAAGLPNPCTPVVRVCAKDVLSGVGQAIPGLAQAKKALDTIGGVLATAGQSVLAAGVAWLSASILSTAQDILDQPGAFLDALTRPRLTAAGFLGPHGAYHVVASFAVVLLVGFIFLGVISGLLSGEPGQAMFRVVRDTPAAVLAIVGFPWLVEQLIAAVDGLCAATLPSGEVLHRLLAARVFTGFDGLEVGLPQLLLALVAFIAAVLVSTEMLVRTVLVRLAVALAPISFAGMIWAPARPAARKAVELTIAGVLAKFAIYLALKVGLDLTGEFTDSPVPGGAAWGSLLLGIAVVCLAAFAPYIVWRLLPHAEAFLAAQGVSRMPARAGLQVLQTAYWIDMIRTRAGGGGGRAWAAGPPPAPRAGGPGPARRPTARPSGGGGGAARAVAGGGAGRAGRAATAGGLGAAVSAGQSARAGKDRVASSMDRPTRPTSPAAGGAAGGGAASGPPEADWVRRPRRAP